MNRDRNQLAAECAVFLSNAAHIYLSVSQRETGDIQIARSYTQELMRRFAGAVPADIDCDVKQIETGSGPVVARYYAKRRLRAKAGNPLVIFFHGGGWSVGDAESYEPFVETLCSLSSVDFISVDFRLAPEHAYPTAHDNCYDAACWVFAHTKQLGVDPERIALMGDSAGAGIAVATSLRLCRLTHHKPHSHYLLYPFLDARNNHQLYPSRMDWGDGEYFISRDGLELASLWYSGSAYANGCPELSPIAELDLSPLPHTTIVVAGCDPLLDEAKDFANRISRVGVSSEVREYAGAFHGFLPFGCLRLARDARQWLVNDLQKRLLSDTSPCVESHPAD